MCLLCLLQRHTCYTNGNPFTCASNHSYHPASNLPIPSPHPPSPFPNPDPSAGVLHLTNKYSERNPTNRISCKAREDNWELPASGYKHDPGSPEDDTLDPTLSILMQGNSRVRFRPGIDGLPGSTALNGGGAAPRRKKSRSGPGQVRPRVDLSQFEEEGSDTRILPPGVDDDSATTQVLDRARVAASVLSSKDLDGEANDRAIATAMLESSGAQGAEGGGGMSLDAQGGVGLAGGGGGGGGGAGAAAGDGELDAGIEAASLGGGMEALNALGGRDLGDPAER